jgi:DNA-directed RNA polymerase subunit RPC12/RpoP
LDGMSTRKPVDDGEWVQPVRRGFQMECCGERVSTLQLAFDNGWNRSGLIDYINTRLGHDNALDAGAHDSPALVRRVGPTSWRKSTAPKRDVKCPSCGHRFDVRRKGLTDAPIEAAGERTHANV